MIEQKDGKHGSKAKKQEPPVAFKKYEKNKSSGGVMGMMQTIIDDAKAMEAEAIVAEEDAQKAYESFVKDSNMSIESKHKEIVAKSTDKAKADEEKVKADQTLEETNSELEDLSNESADLHSNCDYTLKNFDIRQTARAEEIEALKQVKQIL